MITRNIVLAFYVGSSELWGKIPSTHGAIFTVGSVRKNEISEFAIDPPNITSVRLRTYYDQTRVIMTSDIVECSRVRRIIKARR